MTMRAVALGGGHGLARTLRALTSWADDVTAVVTVADDGGSSGRLRRDLGVIPPGDLRMALLALARDGPMAQLVSHRFRDGELAGHSLGNLMLVGMMEQHDGDVLAALRAFAQLLGVRGAVLPCTTAPVTMHAETAHGVVHGQAAIAATSGIRCVWLADDQRSTVDDAPERAEKHRFSAPVEAIDAIGSADMIVVGPGSLYTSVLPNLLVDDIAAAVRDATALKVLIANLREQRGETQGMLLSDHLDALRSHVGHFAVDVVVVNDRAGRTSTTPPIPGLRALYRDDNVAQHLGKTAGAIVEVSMAGDDDSHDPQRLAEVLRQLYAERLQLATTG
ncbi:MAG: gluconeogenesis factor YvcK family protein [Nitriliruptoraceae bacterium]